jgi:hypothetical protein
VHSVQSQAEHKFHLVPYETGKYRFCLKLSDKQKRLLHHNADRSVSWDLQVGHADHSTEHAKEGDAQGLWHYGECVCLWVDEAL